jgi:hypothetical protein
MILLHAPSIQEEKRMRYNFALLGVLIHRGLRAQSRDSGAVMDDELLLNSMIDDSLPDAMDALERATSGLGINPATNKRQIELNKLQDVLHVQQVRSCSSS